LFISQIQKIHTVTDILQGIAISNPVELINFIPLALQFFLVSDEQCMHWFLFFSMLYYLHMFYCVVSLDVVLLKV